MFKLEIETDNSVFDENATFEIARILKDISNYFYRHGNNGINLSLAPSHFDGPIKDVNGNTVGQWRYDKEIKDE